MLDDTSTWDLIGLLFEVNIVGSKWVFKAKKNIAGNVVHYKVIQKFSQVSGVDYFDTFAFFAKLISICADIAIIATHDMEIYQINIKKAFLNSKLTENKHIYMYQLPSFINPTHSYKVCHLKKTLYSLK